LRVYAYISTTEPFTVVKRGKWVDGRPISRHPGYTPWCFGRRETRRLQGVGNMWQRQALEVQQAMGWGSSKAQVADEAGEDLSQLPFGGW